MEKTVEKETVTLKERFKSIKKIMIGFNSWRIIGYLIIYSMLGFGIETIYGVITKGVLESRQSFLYGPFCAIYGVGAIVMIILLQPFKKNNNTLFWGGFFVGSAIEYVISLIGEAIFHVIWWDYSNMPLNLNGRICVYFSIFWGLLGIYLITYINPKVDNLIDSVKKKIPIKYIKTVELTVLIILIADFVVTAYSLVAYYVRIVHDNNINIGDRAQIEAEYAQIYGNETKAKIIYKFWGDKKMLRTFPNLKLQDNDGNIIYFDSILKDIQPYYVKIFDK